MCVCLAGIRDPRWPRDTPAAITKLHVVHCTAVFFCQVKKILNSRPIGVMSIDPKNVEVFTPLNPFCGTKFESFLMIEPPKKSVIFNCTATNH